MLINLFIFVPSFVTGNRYFVVVGWNAILLALYLSALSAYIIWQHGFWPEWSFRLGRPLNPGVLSYLIASAFIASFFVNISHLIRTLLLIVLILAAARVDIISVFIFLLLYMWLGGKRSRFIIFGSLLMGVVVTVAMYTSYSPLDMPKYLLPFERTSILSSREEQWSQAIDTIRASPWLGAGDLVYMERQGGPIESPFQRVHNMFLEMAMSYGIPVGILAFMVYASIARGIYKFWRAKTVMSNTYAIVGMGLLVLALAHTMVDAAFWTNLGDGTTVLVLAIIVPLAAFSERIRRANRVSSFDSRKYPLLPTTFVTK
jgi:O-antigen ligase